MKIVFLIFPALAGVLLLAACAPRTAPLSGAAPGVPRLPPVPPRDGALAIDVVYPGEDATVTTRGRTFIFGNVGTGNASLRINGEPVEVAANGAFLGFLPVPADGVYQLSATAGGQSATATHRVRPPAAAGGGAAGSAALGVVPGSLMPRGAFTLEEGEGLEVRFRGTPGATARLVLPDGTAVPLAERPAAERSSGFMLETETPTEGISEYVGTLPARSAFSAADTAIDLPALIQAAPRPVSGAPGARIELARGTETVRVPLGLSLGVLPAGTSRTGIAATQRMDGMLIGTKLPGSGNPYHWFFPNGTRLEITGERGSEYRVRLTPELSVWVDREQVQLEPAGAPPPRGTVSTVRATAERDWVDVRLTTSQRFPYRVDGDERSLTITVYGASAQTNWLQYGATDPLIERMMWEAAGDSEYRLHIDLAQPLWGYLPFYDPAGNLTLRIRRPPAIDPRNPLRNLYIGVDAGHPPGGAIGPTRYTEAEANLAIAQRLIPMLREAGARVLVTRPDTAAVGLGNRPQMATDSSVHLLVSVHNNAFPDGVNPFESNGTSVFYNAPQSLDLARAFQAELLRELGLRDLGVARADLALVRPTWFPSSLTESMFLMIPQQEAALQDPRVQERIARAHLRAIEAFLRRRAAAATR